MCKTSLNMSGLLITDWKVLHWTDVLKYCEKDMLMPVCLLSGQFGWFEKLAVTAEGWWRLGSSLKVSLSSPQVCVAHCRISLKEPKIHRFIKDLLWPTALAHSQRTSIKHKTQRRKHLKGNNEILNTIFAPS